MNNLAEDNTALKLEYYIISNYLSILSSAIQIL